MSDFAIFLVIGIGFIVLLLIWMVGAAAGRREPGRLPRAAPESMDRWTPSSRLLLERIFADEDREFVAALDSPDVQELFLEERKRITLWWLRWTRKAVGKWMAYYRAAVRKDASLKAGTEFRLAADYFTFVFICNVLRALVWLLGPFRLRAIIGMAAGIAERFASSVGSLAPLDLAEAAAGSRNVVAFRRPGWGNHEKDTEHKSGGRD